LITPPDEFLPLHEKKGRWKQLYDEHFVDGQWKISADDASLVVGLGTTYAMQSGEYRLALDLCRQFLSHKELAPRHQIDITNVYWRHGCAQILLGEVDEGVTLLLRPLHEKAQNARLLTLIIRSELDSLFHDLGFEKPADPRVANLIQQVLAGLPGCKRLSKKATAAKTYMDLSNLVGQSYPERR
jgi:hypothetical protein